VITHPDQARTLLIKHPQLSYALFQALLLNKIVDSAILERMLASSRGSSGATGPPQSGPPPVARQVMPPYPPPGGHYPPPHSHMPPFPPQQHPVSSATPPASAMFSHQQQQAPAYYRPPPQSAPVQPPMAPLAQAPKPGPPAAAAPEFNESQRVSVVSCLLSLCLRVTKYPSDSIP